MTLYGTGGYTYEWIPGDIEDDEPFIALEGVHTAILIGANYIGCSNSDTITYEVFPAPAIVATADDETICFGETVTLTGTGGEMYDWSPASVENGVPFTPATVGTTTYTVIGTDDNGCTAESSIDVTMNSEMSSSSTMVTEVAGADGSIDLTPSGGTPMPLRIVAKTITPTPGNPGVPIDAPIVVITNIIISTNDKSMPNT